jgi:hypothetical protein
MKMRLVISLLVLTIFVITGCKKPDYRNKYLGNWIFEIQSTTVKDGPVSLGSDTSIYNGEIKYGEVADEILLQFQENRHSAVTLRIDPDGKILPKTYSSWQSITITYTGGFEGYNKLQYHYHLSHGIQTNIYETLTGEKE